MLFNKNQLQPISNSFAGKWEENQLYLPFYKSHVTDSSTDQLKKSVKCKLLISTFLLQQLGNNCINYFLCLKSEFFLRILSSGRYHRVRSAKPLLVPCHCLYTVVTLNVPIQWPIFSTKSTFPFRTEMSILFYFLHCIFSLGHICSSCSLYFRFLCFWCFLPFLN